MPAPGKRRKSSAAEKLRIGREAAACTQRGDIEPLLRCEGIYGSLLTAWRKQLALHGSEALAGRKPGRKPKQDAKDRRIAGLEKRSARLTPEVYATLLSRGVHLASIRTMYRLLAVSGEHDERRAQRGPMTHAKPTLTATAPWRHPLRSGVTSTAHIPEPERASQRDPLMGSSSGLPQTCWQLPRPIHGAWV
ncbi:MULTISPECIES: hypothetical protein [Sorangium]|uniref:hypothetical protein n=1 Tax=Sorangium TaxID=39643 RepID=UPI003D9C2DC6